MEFCNASKVRLVLVGIISALILAFPAVSQPETPEWTVYNTANSGLPYKGVTALAIDEQGILWVGTGRWYAFEGGGLAKFDGQNWTVYNTANSGLPNNDHLNLSIDPQGNIWSGTENGVSMFDGQNWTVYLTSNSGLPNNQAGAPLFDNEGNAWFGTVDGLAKFDGTNWTVYKTGNSGLPNNFIWPMTFDGQGNLWIGTFGSGLAKFDGTNWTVYNTANSDLPDNNLVSLTFDLQGNAWIGTLDNGLAKFDGTNWTVYNTVNSILPNNRIWYLAVDFKGSVWACTMGGLVKFDGNNWTVYTTTNSGLPDNNVYCIAFDARGSIWIGTENGGLAEFRPPPVVDFNSDRIVDINDLVILIESWDTDEVLCDIAPPPWGDGVVDKQDLEVFMSHLGEDYTVIAHWKLDETEGDIARDSIGENDGTLYGEPLWQPYGGKVDGALELDGIDDYIGTDPVAELTSGPFSIFAWIKGGAPGQAIISQENSGNLMMADASEGKLMTDFAYGRIVETLVSEAVITDGNWHRVGLTWDGTEKVLCVDDIKVASKVSDAGISEDGLYIGAGKNLDAGTFFSGLIDDVRIHDRAVTP
jgi:sugar lactone lactonase YvrE